jgi:NAD(P)-dependent dehydrogenase (short-subunit alcohol dehydrogenase family)
MQPSDLDPRATDRLRGRVAIVTGSGRGIGRATARRLAAEGARVVVADIDAGAAKEVAEELRAAGAETLAVVADLSTFAGAEELIQTAIGHFGHVDVLVNNVGGATALKPYAEWAPDEIEREIQRSLLPTAWCTRALLPHLIARGTGRIVNVGAESVRNGLWDRAPYNMAKGAVHALTTSVARETAGLGITCNCVAPAATGRQDDRLARRRAAEVDERQAAHVAAVNERMMATIPLGRPAEEEEQAAAIAFLASDDASYITGQVLSVNGGSSML